MAPPSPKPASPYNFRLGSDFGIALIQPFLYFFSAIFPHFLSAIFPDIYFPPQVAPKTPSLKGTASLDICSVTPPDDLLASLGQRRNTIGQQTAISLLFIVVICFASYLDVKRYDTWDFYSRRFSPVANLKYCLYGEDPVTPPDDYRATQRREAMRLLFLVVISALFCPIAHYVCRQREGPFASWLVIWDLPLSYVGKLTIPVMFVFYRYGAMQGIRVTMFLSYIALPCMATAATTQALAFATLGRRYGVVDIWDRRIERWVEAWKEEKLWAETAEWEILRKRVLLQLASLKEVRDEVEVGERIKELLVWRRGMKEGKGYGPDYWLPREKSPRL